MKKTILSTLLGLILLTLCAQAGNTKQRQFNGVLTLADGKKIEFLDISGVREQKRTASVFSVQGTKKFDLEFFVRIPGELVFKPVDETKEEVLIVLGAKVKQVSLQPLKTAPKYRAIVTILFSDGRKEEIGVVFHRYHMIDILLPNGVVTNRYSITKLLGATISFQQ